jgi:transcription elongation GreA/GreB family factor
MKINKAEVLKQIVARLQDSLGLLEKAARASHEEATHESSRAESKYDTRGLEAAYLAGGQARQARDILDAIKVYAELPTRNFGKTDAIDVSAMVTLDFDGTRSSYFIGPKSGGLEINYNGEEVVLITPQSPLGQNLMGRKSGERWTAKTGGATVKYHVVSVS